MSSHGSQGLFKHLIRELFQGEAGGVASLKIIRKSVSKIIKTLGKYHLLVGRFAQNYKKICFDNYNSFTFSMSPVMGSRWYHSEKRLSPPKLIIMPYSV